VPAKGYDPSPHPLHSCFVIVLHCHLLTFVCYVPYDNIIFSQSAQDIHLTSYVHSLLKNPPPKVLLGSFLYGKAYILHFSIKHTFWLVVAIAYCIQLIPSPCDHESPTNAAKCEEAERNIYLEKMRITYIQKKVSLL
jgi:hypothetical protein